ncbi:MAG: hydroxymethylglutaryl-CoA reductase, degradative, partial [Gammaproteobacteria bacterium]|nr:hydroxymethylglutaryl-CoA reductase, degradative [Gammaproteobacteria bacterium]
MKRDSRLRGLHRLDTAARIDALVEGGFLTLDDAALLKGGRPLLPVGTANRMVENVIGSFGLPFAVATNFRVNGTDYLVPMVVEEPSIVAGLSAAARIARPAGGFRAATGESLLAGQIQLVGILEPDEIVQGLAARKAALLEAANAVHPRLVERGGGVRDIEFYKYRLADGRWTIVLHVLVDTCDAMGANLVNTICERVAPEVESLSGGHAILRILSNFADRSLVTAEVSIPAEQLASGDFSGERVRDGIVVATQIAMADVHRAVTHNKGIMNGIDAVAIATGNDWRAIEAAAHAWAVRQGAYRSLTEWTATPAGELHGRLCLPLKVGIVGGSLRANPGVELGLRIAGAGSAAELAGLMAAVGLAQNFAALRALVTDGIQKGHMSLHARSVAAAADVPAEHFDAVVRGLIDGGDIKVWKARELVRELASSPQAAELQDAGKGSAAGKVILLGEHAVVYGKHALALPLPDAVVARIAPRDGGLQLVVIEGGARTRLEPGHALEGLVELVRGRLGIADDGYSVEVETRIPPGMGLGASAAFAVAIIRAFANLKGLDLDAREVDAIAFECEKLAHGTPSGIDNNLATYAEPVLYSKGRDTRTRPIELAISPPMVVATSAVR